jgi:hypothetical protein
MSYVNCIPNKSLVKNIIELKCFSNNFPTPAQKIVLFTRERSSKGLLFTLLFFFFLLFVLLLG